MIMTVWLAGWLAVWLSPLLADSLAGLLAGWLAGLLTSLLAGLCHASWLAGQLAHVSIGKSECLLTLNMVSAWNRAIFMITKYLELCAKFNAHAANTEHIQHNIQHEMGSV